MNITTAQPSNVPEFSVSEIAFSLKKTLEDTYGRVRVRGELSRVSIPRSGHLYTGLKDDKSVLDAVCWKGVLAKLPLRPEEGLEVICTGKITTYPMSSKYQLVIETMELAGEGALLKMLEDRKKRLAAEGLFAAERKKPLPFLPQHIGVVTSPTGAVIRDILHRLQDRFPRRVTVWPVKVQGEGAANEITAAIDGFNALPHGQKPDILIVARGGGSLEDLMAFNEENVVRATANSQIPIISAVGHETDTTLIDYVSDLRAPTPTGAAEKAVPVRLNLLAQITDDHNRLVSATARLIADHKQRVSSTAARLGNPNRLLDIKTQQLDRASDTLSHRIETRMADATNRAQQMGVRLIHPQQLLNNKAAAFSYQAKKIDDAYQSAVLKKTSLLSQKAGRLSTPRGLIRQKDQLLSRWTEQLERVKPQIFNRRRDLITQASEKLELLSYHNVLQRGYVVIRDEAGHAITDAQTAKNGENIVLHFRDHKTRTATLDDAGAPQKPPPPPAKPVQKSPPKKKPVSDKTQGFLFD